MAVLTVQDIINNIVAQLRASDPAISAEIGTPERKIIEAVAEVISVNQSDLSVLNSQHDVDTMAGNRLDQFLANFGFGRKRPTQAQGTVTFSRPTVATTDILIPAGVQVISRQTDEGFPAVIFVTTLAQVLTTGTTSVDIPVEATLPGTLSNIPANSIYAITGSIQVPGVTDVTNTNVIGGGSDGETDDDFKVRFKNTIFRNQAGTQDQFLAFAVSLANVSKANVIGPMSRYQEYIQVPVATDVSVSAGDGERPYDPANTVWPGKKTSAISTITYSKYTYDSGFYLTDGATDSGAIFFRQGLDFVFNNPRVLAGDSNSDATGDVDHRPNVTFLNLAADVSGTTYLFEHAYMSAESRNDPSLGIFNCVDMFIDGKNEVEVVSVEPKPTLIFTAGDGTIITDKVNFKRRINGSTPTTGNYLQLLFWQPMETLPDQIDSGGNSYYKAKYISGGNPYSDPEHTIAAHYYEVVDMTELYGSVRCRNGIEWITGVVGVPSGDEDPATIIANIDTEFDLTYTYDQNVADLQSLLEQNKQITTDVLAHQSVPVYLKLRITVAYTPGANISGTNFAITTALNNFYHTQYFGANIQLSDLLQTIHNTPGVDNVRFTTAAHPVEVVNKNGTALDSPTYHDEDFFLKDNELVFSPDVAGTDVSTVIIVTKRATNTWNQP